MEGRAAAVAGVGFAVSFFVGMALVSDLAGSFGDPDEAFVEHFESGSRRAADIVGSVLLVVAAVAFVLFSLLLDARGRDSGEPTVAGVVVRGAGALTGVAILVGALALLTVPLSISFGELFDDPAFITGQAVLPQLGYVALTVGAVIPAVVTSIAVTRLRTARWLTWLSCVVAVLLVLTSTSVVTVMVLLPLWVIATVVAMARRRARDVVSV